MRRRPLAALAALLLAAVAVPALAPAATAPSWTQRVAVKVPWHPSAKSPVRIAFHPRTVVPRHGYYYAVAVLEHYRLRSAPDGAPHPACAVSSNMEKTQYGHASRDGHVRLALLAAASPQGHWCAHGLYEGAVYAVPHAPPCTPAYPCYGRASCGPAGGFCGVVALPLVEYSYPAGLPKPLDRSTRVIGHFTIHISPAQ